MSMKKEETLQLASAQRVGSASKKEPPSKCTELFPKKVQCKESPLRESNALANITFKSSRNAKENSKPQRNLAGAANAAFNKENHAPCEKKQQLDASKATPTRLKTVAGNGGVPVCHRRTPVKPEPVNNKAPAIVDFDLAHESSELPLAASKAMGRYIYRMWHRCRQEVHQLQHSNQNLENACASSKNELRNFMQLKGNMEQQSKQLQQELLEYTEELRVAEAACAGLELATESASSQVQKVKEYILMEEYAMQILEEKLLEVSDELHQSLAHYKRLQAVHEMFVEQVTLYKEGKHNLVNELRELHQCQQMREKELLDKEAELLAAKVHLKRLWQLLPQLVTLPEVAPLCNANNRTHSEQKVRSEVTKEKGAKNEGNHGFWQSIPNKLNVDFKLALEVIFCAIAIVYPKGLKFN